MELSPQDVAQSDQMHASATRLLDHLIDGARHDLNRFDETGDILSEAADVTFLAHEIRAAMLDHPGSEMVAAQIMALSIYRLAKTGA